MNKTMFYSEKNEYVSNLISMMRQLEVVKKRGFNYTGNLFGTYFYSFKDVPQNEIWVLNHNNKLKKFRVNSPPTTIPDNA
jgi:hypothetical protein